MVDEPNPDKAMQAGRQTGGVDLVVLGAKPDPADFLVRMRKDPALAALPAVVASSDERLRRLASEDSSHRAHAGGGRPRQHRRRGGAGHEAGLGRLADARTDRLLGHSCRRRHRPLGTTGNTVFDIAQTTTMLTSALDDAQADVVMAAAKALAAMPAPQAQQALAERALTTTVAEQARVELLKLLASSLRRFGNSLSEAQAEAIVSLVADSKQPQALREAAAQVLGAMNLPSEKIRSLIVGAGS